MSNSPTMVRILVGLVVLINSAVLLAGEAYTCSNCGTTFPFPSNAGSYRSDFIKSHKSVCRPQIIKLPPYIPDPRIKELEEELAIERLKQLVGEYYIDMHRRELRSQSEFLISEIKEIHDAWDRFYERVRDIQYENEGLVQRITRERRVSERAKQDLEESKTNRQKWETIAGQLSSRIEEMQQELMLSEDDVFSSLEQMRQRGMISGAAQALPLPPAPTADGSFPSDGLVRIPGRTWPTIESTYPYDPLPSETVYVGPVHVPVRAQVVRAARRWPDPNTISVSELLDLRAEYEYLKVKVIDDGRRLAQEAFDARNASADTLKELKANNEMTRVLTHAAKRASHVYRHEIEQHYKDLYVAELRKAAIENLEGMAEKRLGTKTMATGRAFINDAKEEIEKFTPYISTLKRLQDYGDTMHGLTHPGGYMQRLFEGIRASTYLHYDPERAEEVWGNLQVARENFARQLQDQGLPEGFTETRMRLEQWFAQE